MPSLRFEGYGFAFPPARPGDTTETGMRALWSQERKLSKHLKIFKIESLDLFTALVKIAFPPSIDWKPIYSTLEGKWKRFGTFEVVQGKLNRAQSSIQIQFHIVGSHVGAKPDDYT